jgi:hypothetical protein
MQNTLNPSSASNDVRDAPALSAVTSKVTLQCALVDGSKIFVCLQRDCERRLVDAANADLGMVHELHRLWHEGKVICGRRIRAYALVDACRCAKSFAEAPYIAETKLAGISMEVAT